MESGGTAGEAFPVRTRRRLTQFWAYTPIGRVGRVILLAVVLAVVILDVVLAVTGAAGDPPARTIAQVALTASFALFAWRPPTAALVLLVGALMSVSLGAGDEPLVALVVAVGLVVATCSVALSAVFVTGYFGLLALALLAQPRDEPLVLLVSFTVSAGLSVLVGYALRRTSQRAIQLTDELAERERMLESAVRLERERLADELHDFIAHELTIIAMHARVLEQSPDPEVQVESRDAISTSARQALADIRRVLEVTQASRPIVVDDVDEPVIERRRLVPTITDIERELATVGTRVEADGLYEIVTQMSRTMEVALAQFLREAATNIVKHAASTDSVSVRFSSTDDDVVMRIENAIPGVSNSLALPPGGYGIARMRERASVLGGAFSAGPTPDGWLVEVQLPLR